MAGLFDNIFTTGQGGLLDALLNSQQPLGARGFQPGAPLTMPDMNPAFWRRGQPIKAGGPSFSAPGDAASLSTLDFAPGFLPNRGTLEATPAQYPPQLNMIGMAPTSGDESAGLNMQSPFAAASAPKATPAAQQPVDPWAGIRGVNEQPPAIGNNQSMLPASAVPTQALQQGMPQQSPSPDFADRLGAGFMGFANSRSPMQALGNLFSGFATGQRSDPAGMTQRQQSATFKALVGRGVPPNEAMAATLNPDIMKIVGAKYFDTQGKVVEGGADPLTGQKPIYEYRNGKLTTLTPDGGNSNGVAPTTGFFAPGVTNINRNLIGEDYLNQFSPEVRAAVKAYHRGDSMPTSNPRLAGGIGAIKQIAQKYGDDIGVPASDALYSQRRTYRSQLGSNSPSSAGGQAKSFNQGIEHLSALADTLEKLDNSNGGGIPSLASGINTVRQGLSTDQAAIADKASGIGQALAGEVGKLFSGSSGGGVHERQQTMERFNTVKSKPQLAAALEATLELMHGGLTALEQRRDEVLGPNSDVKFVTEETQKKIQHVQDMITKLKGNAPATKAASGGTSDPLGIR